jgi:hypothetical protein
VFHVSVGIYAHIDRLHVCKCIMGYEYFIYSIDMCFWTFPYEVYARNFKCIFFAFDLSVSFDACARFACCFLGNHTLV